MISPALLSFSNLHGNGSQCVSIEISSPLLDIPARLYLADITLILAAPGARVEHLAHLFPKPRRLTFHMDVNRALHAGPFVLLPGLAVCVCSVGKDFCFLDVAVFDSVAGVDVAIGLEGPTPVFVGVGKFELQAMLVAFVGESEKTPLIPPHDGNLMHGLKLMER